MKYKDIPLKHLEFIKLVAGGLPYKDAYQVSSGYQTVSKNSPAVQGSKLAKRYAVQIQEARDKSRELILAAQDKQIVKLAVNQIVSQAEADAKVFKILSYDDFVEESTEVFEADGTSKKTRLLRKATPAEIQKAYELYCKRFGSYVVVTKSNPNDPPPVPVDTVQVICYLPAKNKD